MRKAFILFLITALLPLGAVGADVKQNRGLIAFTNGNFIQVEWRMRATDNPMQTQYCLYADGKLYGTYRSKTTARLNASKYAGATFSIVVKDKDGNEIDRQDGVKAWSNPYLDIPLTAPVVYSTTADTAIVKYEPLDASAYDMDGDGEQEILLKWGVSWTGEHAAQSDRREFVDCYKLNGKRLWRIDFGQNTVVGNNFTFMVWDFDGDGRGEMIVKTAPGTKDATGKYVGSGLKGYADIETIYSRGSDGGPTAGEEWITCFDGVTGKELVTKEYWPYFSIQSDWNPEGGADGAGYGRRGNGFKGAVIKIPCRDGQTRPVCYMQRGIYTFVYATAISWDGTNLVEEWRHSSVGKASATTVNASSTHTQTISLYAQGAHSGEAGDLDGDGYDEVCIGAAAIDHDGTVMWSSGLGHGDAIGVGEFNPNNPGLETWRVTEVGTGYSSCMFDGKTGKMLNGQEYSGGDVDRGVIMDLDSLHAGHEYWHNASTYVYDCDGNALYEYYRGNNTGYPNFRIFWDDDLLDEHFDGKMVAKFDLDTHKWVRATLSRGNTTTLWSQYGVSYINSTKGNANLVCDLLGDFREELVMYKAAPEEYPDYDCCLRIITSPYDTGKKLPWLRDDNTYNLQIASQNVGYSMPPHLSYNAHEWYKSLTDMGADEIETEETSYFQPVRGAYYTIATTDGLSADMTAGVTKGFLACTESGFELEFVYVNDSTYYIKGKDGQYLTANGGYGFALNTDASLATPFIGYADGDYVYFKSTADPKGNGNVWLIFTASRKAISRGSSQDSAYRFVVKPTGNTTGIEAVEAEADGDKAWYTLGGIKTIKPRKGIYVQQGRKVIMK